MVPHIDVCSSCSRFSRGDIWQLGRRDLLLEVSNAQESTADIYQNIGRRGVIQSRRWTDARCINCPIPSRTHDLSEANPFPCARLESYEKRNIMGLIGSAHVLLER
jgi:hypothetical protein